jgi:N utilization substance protein A
MSYDPQELQQQIEMLCIERGLEQEEVMRAIEQSIASAYRKEIGDKEKMYDAKFHVDKGTYDIFEVTTIVEEVEFPTREIDLVEARLTKPDAELGDKLIKEVATDQELKFGRIAAQVARQVNRQTVNSVRHSKVLQQFKERIGDIVNVEIDYWKKGGYVVKLAQTTGYLSKEQLLPIDRFKAGQVVKALIVDISEDAKGNSRIVLSRTDNDFVMAILRNEVPEVESGVVVVNKIVRVPGMRTKLLVSAPEDDTIDPVGTILGKKNIRIINVVREISSSMQEKVDVIEYNPDDLELMILDALEPAEIERVEIAEDGLTAKVYCYPEEAALAVGRKGMNIRLAGEILGLELEVVTLDDDSSDADGYIAAAEDEGDSDAIVDLGE